MYDLYISTEVGLLKGINLQQNKFQNLNNPKEIENDEGITAMAFNKKDKSEIVLSLKNNSLVTYDCNESIFKNKIVLECGEGKIIDLFNLNGQVVTAQDSGLIKIWSKRKLKGEIKTGDNLHVMRHNQFKQSLIATGGKENDLKLWDLNKTESPIFKAKNVPNNFLDLRVPVWIKEIQFYDETKIITGTAHHQIRLYDCSASKKKPVIDFEFDEYPVTSIATTPMDYQIVAGNSHGRLALLDLRTKKLVHAFKKIAGSIRDVKVHPTEPLVFSGSLDRYLRIYDLNKHTLVNRIYLKSRVISMLQS